MKLFATILLCLTFSLPIFSQFEISAAAEVDFKFNDKTERLVPNSGFLFYGFNAAIGYGITSSFKVGIQSGGLFTSGYYEDDVVDPETFEITETNRIESKMSIIPVLASIGTTIYDDKMRYVLEVAGGPFLASRTTNTLIEKKALWGFRPSVGIDFQLSNNLLFGFRSQGSFIFTKVGEFESLEYGNSEEKVLFLGGASIGFTFIIL